MVVMLMMDENDDNLYVTPIAPISDPRSQEGMFSRHQPWNLLVFFFNQNGRTIFLFAWNLVGIPLIEEIRLTSWYGEYSHFS